MRRFVRRSAAVALAITIVVGPVGSSPAGSDPYAAARRALKDVPCKAEVGAETSKNLKTLQSQTWPPDIETGELDVDGGLLLGHIYGSPGGLVTVDVSDPLRTKILSIFRLEGYFTYDVKMTVDRSTALLGFDDGLAFAGIAAVDIRDPAKPRLMNTWLSDRPGLLQNAHMLYTERIDGTDWIFLAPNDSTGVWVLKLVGPPGDRKIEYVTQTLLVEGGPLGPHDMYIGFDEALDTWVLYAADGYEGWLAYDIGDPTAPLFLGGFLHPSSGYTHTIQAGWIGERRIVATVEEVGVNLLKVYDATDLAMPVLLGVWHQSEGSGPVASQHNLQIVDEQLYVAHYGNGIFVFDLKKIAEQDTPITSEIEPVARYHPESTSFWDVVLEDGLVYTGKFSSGGGFDVVGF
ncbi:MAG: LVIVD repeat-containing protein, partial [Actinomycetota bacterium]